MTNDKKRGRAAKANLGSVAAREGGRKRARNEAAVLGQRLKERKNRRRNRMKLFYVFLLLVVMSPIIILIFAALGGSDGKWGGIFALWRGELTSTSVMSLTFLGYFAMFAYMVFVLRAQLREVDIDIRDLNFEIELSEYPIHPREVRAERLFRMNQYELIKYYSLNLGQNRLIVSVGLGCILLGLVVVFVTFYIIMGGWSGSSAASGTETAVKNFEVWVKAIVAAVGVVGTILVNYVASIFLKMHAEAAKALSDFHERLVATNQLFLANVLASRIEDESKRQDTLAELAKAITKK